MTEIKIAPLCEEQLAGACEVEKASLELPWSESQLASFVTDDDKFYYTAAADGCVVGIAGFYRVLDECMIMNVAVLEGYRRQGIAGRLLEVLLCDAVKNGCTFATLETAADNAAAVALYEKYGFIQNGRRKGYYHGVDALLFKKEL